MNMIESFFPEFKNNPEISSVLSACFTGHRAVPVKEIPLLKSLLCQCVTDAYDMGIRTFYCGAALGFDLLAGYEVVRLQQIHPDIHLILVIPCAEQSRFWSAPDREIYNNLIQSVRSRYPDDVIVLSPFYYSGCMQVRNHYMVDRSQLCISYQYNLSGGTFSTVRYAQKKGVPVLNLYPLTVQEYSGTQSADSFLRESDFNGAVYSYSVLPPKMQLLRLRFVSGPFRHVGTICYNDSFRGGKKVLRAELLSLHGRNRLYRWRHSFPVTAGSAVRDDKRIKTIF